MVDRVKLLQSALASSELTTKQKNTVNTNVEKALNEALSGMPLSAARTAPNTEDLILYIFDSAPQRTLQAISKNWEPQRGKLDTEQNSDLKHDLVSLLKRQRKPYSKPTTPLAELALLQRKELEELHYTISRIAPAADLGALLKQWDPHIPKKPKNRNELVPHLLALACSELDPHPSKKLTLTQFRGMSDHERNAALGQLNERENLKELQTRAKKWDKYNQTQLTTKNDVFRHLQDLVKSIVEPASKPKLSKTRK